MQFYRNRILTVDKQRRIHVKLVKRLLITSTHTVNSGSRGGDNPGRHVAASHLDTVDVHDCSVVSFEA